MSVVSTPSVQTLYENEQAVAGDKEEMKQKIICIGVVCLFLLTGLTVVSATEPGPQNDNNAPEIKDFQTYN